MRDSVVASWRKLLPGGYGECQKQNVMSQRTIKKRRRKIQDKNNTANSRQMIFSRANDGIAQITRSQYQYEETEAWGDRLLMK